MSWLYWLSFADPTRPSGTQFLGVVILPAADIVVGAVEAHRLGLNPGGEVLGMPLPEHCRIHPSWVGILLDRATIDRLDADDGAGWLEERT